MNAYAIGAMYSYEMARTRRTLLQSVVSPVLSTSLYFVVFGAAIGAHMSQIGGVSYGAFIVPGLIMLGLLTQSIANASFGIISRASSARFMSSCRRRCRLSKSSSLMSARRRPNRWSSA
jgi:ABC-type multidrug transport system permease subunit